MPEDELGGTWLAEGVRAGIQRARGSHRPEAELREAVQPRLADALRAAGLRSGARDEAHLSVPTARSAADLDAPLEARGRADAVYNRFVIEFEPPGALRPSVMHSGTRHAVAQVQQYLRGLAAESGLQLERLAGCAFDGSWIVYVTWERGEWIVARPRAATPDALDGLLLSLGSLASGRGLTAGNLHEDFGRRSETARHAVPAIARLVLAEDPSPRTTSMYEQWLRDQGSASGQLAVSDLSDWRELCRALGVPGDQERSRPVLFALQTYFSIVAKLTALVILEGSTGLRLVSRLRAHQRDSFLDLESGRMTAETRATNAVEPGIFSWYAHETDAGLWAAMNRMVEIADEYSAEVVDVSPGRARDLMKDLYQRLVPTTIRHRLGEYYTPDWLAERVVTMVTGARERIDPSVRVLDPACGSGTFLAEVITRMVAGSGRLDPDRAVVAITENVVGFDLSPLAVQASKVNYLLAIAPLLSRGTASIRIPVYLTDSVSPARRGGLLEGDVLILETSEGEWTLPAAIADRRGMSALRTVLDEALSAGQDLDWVISEIEVRSAVALSPAARTAVGSLLEKLRALDAADRDGMWLPLLANAFAPLLHEPFDYVVGNPPWVSWETLPEAYRRANEGQWDLYRLRPEVDPARRQASANVQLDLAMLFVARSVDAYLADTGRLGFVITASVFQSELAGRGFRRRMLPAGRRYRFLFLDDMSALSVFDDAANRTAVLVADKRTAGPGLGPIPVARWDAPAGQRTIPTDLELRQVVHLTRRRHLLGEPASPADGASPLLVMDREGLQASRPLRQPSPYADQIREGINTRGANGVLFVEVLARDGDLAEITNIPALGRNAAVGARRGWVERAALRQLVRGSDVGTGRWGSSLSVLFFHDDEHTARPLSPTEASRRFPRAYEYVCQFEDVLRGRRIFRNFDPSGDDWLGLYSVTSAALAEHKVVIREIAAGLVAAAVDGRDVVPDHKLYAIPVGSAAEGALLTRVLNTDVVNYTLRSFALSTSISGSFLRYIGVRDVAPLAARAQEEDAVATALGLTPSQYERLRAVAQRELASTRAVSDRTVPAR
jgi:SAM-dependent methyltransferase